MHSHKTTGPQLRVMSEVFNVPLSESADPLTLRNPLQLVMSVCRIVFRGSRVKLPAQGRGSMSIVRDSDIM